MEVCWASHVFWILYKTDELLYLCNYQSWNYLLNYFLMTENWDYLIIFKSQNKSFSLIHSFIQSLIYRHIEECYLVLAILKLSLYSRIAPSSWQFSCMNFKCVWITIFCGHVNLKKKSCLCKSPLTVCFTLQDISWQNQILIIPISKSSLKESTRSRTSTQGN